MRLLMATFVAALLLCLMLPAHAAPEFSADDARRDLRLLKRAFTELHPGLYRYTSAAQLDADFAAAETEVAQGASRAQMFLLVSRLAASVRCGHTWAGRYNQPKAVVEQLFNRADKLPFTLRVVQGRFLVTGSMRADIAPGAEVLTIDGQSSATIVSSLMPYIRADGGLDGSTDGKRLSQLDSGSNGGAMDRLFPLRFPPQGGGFDLSLCDAPGKAPRSLRVSAVREAERDAAGLAPASSAWAFSIEGDTAWLTLPTFAFWGSRFDGRAFLARSFAELDAKKIPFLVIDIRRNEGGDDQLGHALLSYLLREPFSIPGGRRESAYERAPYNLVRYLDTWDYSFFDRTGKATRGPGRNWLLSDSASRRIEPAAVPYAGRSIVLVGPQNSSAGHLLARDVQRSKAATLVGQRTGGNLRGLNGGEITWITLPTSGVAVDIPLLAHFAPGTEPDGGVLPDITVPALFDEAAAGIDADVAAARRLIANWR